MTKEAEKVQLDYEILGNVPKILLEGEAVPGSRDFIENSLLELGRNMARHSIGEGPHIPAKDLKQDRDIAQSLSKIKIDDPSLQKPDIGTDQGIIEIAELAIAKVIVKKESVPDLNAKAKLDSLANKIAKSITKLLATPTRGRQFISKSVLFGLALTLTACGTRGDVPTFRPGFAAPVTPQMIPLPPGCRIWLDFITSDSISAYDENFNLVAAPIKSIAAPGEIGYITHDPDGNLSVSGYHLEGGLFCRDTTSQNEPVK